MTSEYFTLSYITFIIVTVSFESIAHESPIDYLTIFTPPFVFSGFCCRDDGGKGSKRAWLDHGGFGRPQKRLKIFQFSLKSEVAVWGADLEAPCFSTMTELNSYFK